MVIRISLQGDAALAGVAASVVERLARDTGFQDDEARGLAESARDACAEAMTGGGLREVSAEARGARVRLSVEGGEPGEARIEAGVAGRPA